MGMGNDGIEVSNSLDTTCTQVNNSGIRDVNSQKSIDVMQNENAMGNITSTDGNNGMDSPFSGATENCPGSLTDSGDINNAPLSSTEEQNDENYSKPTADELLPESAGRDGAEENEDNKTLSQDNAVSSENNDANEDNKTVVVVEDEDRNAKPNTDIINPNTTCYAEPTPAPVYRNESLLRVSYLKRDWGGKRVSDIRSVSDLLETFYSLEEPIIMPLPRQRDYYDQWARTPRGDVIQRLYPRAGSSVSTKCWTLFQTIQNDQGKSNPTPSLASSPQRLAPPSNNDVMCDSLDSIIEHYNNHFLEAPPVEAVPNLPVRTTTQRVMASQIRANSGSSRSSSCGSNRGNIGANNVHKPDGNGLKAPGLKSKIMSPVPGGGKMKKAGHATGFISPSNFETKVTEGNDNQSTKKSHFPDYELCPDTASDSVLSNAGMFDISTHERVNRMTSTVAPKTQCLRRTDVVENPHGQNEVLLARSTHGQVDLLSPLSARECRDVTPRLQTDSTYPTAPSPSSEQNGKDADGNVYGINTNTLNLSLSFERAHTIAEIHAPSTKSLRPKSKLSSPYEDLTSERLKPSEAHERFPLRSNAFISRGKRGNTMIDFSHNRTKLKNLTRSIPTRSHNIHDLKDSLLIHEINCDTDKYNDQHTWEYPLKRRSCSTQRTQPLKHECRPATHLPARMQSMLEHHLSPTPSTMGNLSPEELQTPSRRHSAVSLASVHFLDLADLKDLLKRSKTTIHHL